ncbi:SH3 domain-containing protein [Devosia sp. 2618]|uniref:SH3 domain-containing protein n=1 Tax=Devosia sp. 2618 TaxID=3156454 RepID=UPI003391F779
MFEETKPSGTGRPLKFACPQLAWLLVFITLLTGPVFAQANNPSGLPLPRFASTRSDPINVRVGPGQRYEIAWTFLKAGIPVEIIQEFDTWRKIRDVDGDEGWIHQNLLTGTRVGYVAPLVGNGEIVLRSSQSDEAGVRARLGPGLKVTVKECDGTWCEVNAASQDPNQRSTTYSGYLHQEELWGVYPDEVFD